MNNKLRIEFRKWLEHVILLDVGQYLRSMLVAVEKTEHQTKNYAVPSGDQSKFT